MKNRLYFLLSLILVFSQLNISGQDYIMLIRSSENDNSIVDILTNEGYTVVPETGTYTGILEQAKLDSLNNAALVIISRNASSYGHGDDASYAGISDQWAEISAPILSLSPWMLRNNRWKWFDTDALTCSADEIIIPEAAKSHPIYTDVDVSSGILVFTNDTMTKNEHIDTVEVGYGTILAYDSTQTGIMIAEWESGFPFYSGDNIPTAASKRMFLAITEGDNCPVGDNNLMSNFNGTDAGLQIFLNAVAYMQGIHLGPNGINDINNSLSNIYPNPVTDILTLDGLKNTIRFEIINLTGTIVLNGLTSGSIKVEPLRPGVYLLKTETNQYYKFIKK